MTTTDHLADTTTYDDACCAEADIRAITDTRMVERKSGRHAVRLDVELGVVSCDTLETKWTASYLDLDLDEAEQLAWQILTAVADLRTKDA